MSADDLAALGDLQRQAEVGYLQAAEAAVTLLLLDQPEQARQWAQIAAEHYRSVGEAATMRRRLAEHGGLLLERLWTDPDDQPRRSG